MKRSHLILRTICNVLLFLILESFCLFLIYKNGVIQKYAILEKARALQFIIWDNTSSLKNYTNLSKINDKLAQDNFELMRLNSYYKNQIIDIKGKDYLQAVEDSLYAKDLPFSYDWAMVVKNTVNSAHNYLIINKGADDGVEEDMGVITLDGVVGVIRSVAKNHSYVFSLLNDNQQVSAKISHTGAFGPLKWDKASLKSAVLTEIPQHTLVNRGDTIYTSGYSSFYPPDIPLGVVTGYKIVRGTHLEVDIDLFMNFQDLNYVTIVRVNKGEEINNLSKSL